MACPCTRHDDRWRVESAQQAQSGAQASPRVSCLSRSCRVLPLPCSPRPPVCPVQWLPRPSPRSHAILTAPSVLLSIKTLLGSVARLRSPATAAESQVPSLRSRTCASGAVACSPGPQVDPGRVEACQARRLQRASILHLPITRPHVVWATTNPPGSQPDRPAG
jgi:hypothetical protein